MKTLLSIDTNAKTIKGQKKGYLTGILYLAPSNESGTINTCPHASKGCRIACLYTAGRGAFNNVRNARVDKTLLFHSSPDLFMEQLVKDVEGLKRKASKKGLTPCVRLNGTSDIKWHKIPARNANNIFELFPEISFYDYTKDFGKLVELKEKPIKNYSITFSRSESNQEKALMALKMGYNVASVFRVLPPESFGVPVVNGDESDLRFLDPKGVVVGLKAKGKAKADKSGFVL
jgi:hypothetical protein